MPSYSGEFRTEANRIAQVTLANLGARVTRLVDAGRQRSEILQSLLDDIDNAGPIFGPFLRSLGGAASQATMAAFRQGEAVAAVRASPAAMEALERAGGNAAMLDKIIEDADPEGAAEIERATEQAIELTWIAVLRNTCPYCLVLHGQTRTRAEWRKMGISPETIHEENLSGRGGVPLCHCRFLESELARKARGELTAPLKRVAAEKGTGRTKRAVLQHDLDKAIAARDDALRSDEGQRLLRRLGQANMEKQ